MATAEGADEMAASSQESDTSTRASDFAVLGAGLSVLLSLFEYYVRDNDQRGIFIGHWAPTILAFAIYLRQRRDTE
jgi:hypothetical protein